MNCCNCAWLFGPPPSPAQKPHSHQSAGCGAAKGAPVTLDDDDDRRGEKPGGRRVSLPAARAAATQIVTIDRDTETFRNLLAALTRKGCRSLHDALADDKRPMSDITDILETDAKALTAAQTFLKTLAKAPSRDWDSEAAALL